MVLNYILVGCPCFKVLQALTNNFFGNVQCQFWFMSPCFKGYSSYKFDWQETIRDRAKMNLAGHRVLRHFENYFKPWNGLQWLCNFQFRDDNHLISLRWFYLFFSPQPLFKGQTCEEDMEIAEVSFFFHSIFVTLLRLHVLGNET